jgi:CPA1 family monovalent cation:H+ antiporter
VLLAGVAVSATAVIVRLIWVPLAAIIPRAISPALRKRDPMPAWSSIFLIGWSGMRGIVTLAAALALPLTTAAGTPFPFRAEIILISFGVILVTLVAQGLSLGPLICMLKMDQDKALEQEEMLARQRAAAAALARLNQLALDRTDGPTSEDLERLKDYYSRRIQRFGATDVDPECTKEAAEACRQMRHEALDVERETVIDLRNDGTISDEVLHRLEQELDLEAMRLGLGHDRHDQHTVRRTARQSS